MHHVWKTGKLSSDKKWQKDDNITYEEKGNYFWRSLAVVRPCFDRSELPGNPGRILERYGLCPLGCWYCALAPWVPLEQERKLP